MNFMSAALKKKMISFCFEALLLVYTCEITVCDKEKINIIILFAIDTVFHLTFILNIGIFIIFQKILLFLFHHLVFLLTFFQQCIFFLSSIFNLLQFLRTFNRILFWIHNKVSLVNILFMYKFNKSHLHHYVKHFSTIIIFYFSINLNYY